METTSIRKKILHEIVKLTEKYVMQFQDKNTQKKVSGKIGASM